MKKRSYLEDDLQMAVARYLDYLPDVVWFHVANERLTSARSGARLKKKGVKSGVPDVMILNQEQGYSGLAIELKIKPNGLSPNQKKWMQKLSILNYRCETCYSFDEVQKVIDDYFN